MTSEVERVELETPDLAAEKLAVLQELFPGAVADGVLDAGRIGELVGLDVAGLKDGPERYGLMWAGKHEAVQSLLRPSRGTLVPDVDNSVEFDTAQNVFIEGDNLEVLKLLQKSYNDQVKLIYIDPPYNTGNDLVYNDDFTDGLRAYLGYSGQMDTEGNRVSANVDTAGRKHSRWLSMMYPRLVLARNLMRQDGFIFISINDIEQSALRQMCDEIFGEEQFVETFIWESIFRPSNMSRRVRRNAEYVLCYRRNILADFELVERYQDPQGEASLTQNNNSFRTLVFPANSLQVKLPAGVYPAGAFGEVELLTDLTVDGRENTTAVHISGRFKWSQPYLDDEIAKGVYLAIKTRTFIPYYRKDYQQTKLRPTKIIPSDLVGDVLQANAEVTKLLGPGVFDYPKPTSLVQFLINMCEIGQDALVMDFFAGSGVTADAVFRLNHLDGGSRHCVSVNLPEPTAEGSAAARAGFKTISEVAQARIKSAMASIGAASAMGLRIFSLSNSNFATDHDRHEQQFDELRVNTLLDQEPRLDALAVEVLLREGVRLDAAWQRITVGGEKAVRSGDILVILSRRLSDAVIDEAVAVAPRVLVFLEDGFAGRDSVKTDAFHACQQANITMKTV